LPKRWPTATALPDGRLVELDCGHYDVYVDDWFERTVAAEIDFLATVPLR
jgi:hypothetical protein